MVLASDRDSGGKEGRLSEERSFPLGDAYQQKDVKVFLSLGAAFGPQDAKEVANYLFQNFLSNQFGPQGSVTLNGIDLDIEGDGYWDDLVKELDDLRQQNQYFYFNANAPMETSATSLAHGTSGLQAQLNKWFWGYQRLPKLLQVVAIFPLICYLPNS
ncbi:unnamed protein product [Sphenostylis stenocarpa]|uniref:Uncharacterized protein n=1 Tax=Sphenostylis stenocarpa TaxID=92480 RepID=A0AA86W1V2_9FABA|nr:unnamed protein product [Sphenostylis stenocarpa]